MRVLLIEPDARLAQPIAFGLRQDGHLVEWQHRGDDLLSPEAMFDAWLIDTAAPRQPRLRRQLQKSRPAGATLPVILMSDRPVTPEQMSEWDVGLSDCLLKPVPIDQVRERLRALVRRLEEPMACRVIAGDLDIEYDRRAALRAGRRVHLTLHEWEVLAVLAAHPGRAAGKVELMSVLSGAASVNAVEFHISRLRRKLGAGSIETLRGAGYRLAV